MVLDGLLNHMKIQLRLGKWFCTEFKFKLFHLMFTQILVVVDGSMVAEHKNEVKFYVLNIIKMVNSLNDYNFPLDFFKVDSIFKDKSIGNHIKVETVKVMSLEGATFGYMRHSGSNKVNLFKFSCIIWWSLADLFRFQHLRCWQVSVSGRLLWTSMILVDLNSMMLQYLSQGSYNFSYI